MGKARGDPLAPESERERKRRIARTHVLIERGSGVKLRMLQLPGETEPIPSVYTCPNCGDLTRLVMLVVDPPIPRVRTGPGGKDSRPERIQLLLSITKRQAEQVLAEFGNHPSA
jgi:hypothetical protein